MFHFVENQQLSAPARNGEIDVLRGVAIMLVLMNHVSVAFVAPPALLGSLPIDGCSIGVALFFAVSGYIIAFTWRMDDRRRSYDRRAFYIRRIFRILPLSLLWVEITLIGTKLCNIHGYFGQWDTNSRAAAWVLMLAANIGMKTETGGLGALGVYWSLAVEEQFYVVVPFLMLLGRRGLLLALVGLLVSVIVFHDGTVAKDLYQFTPLLMGLLVGIVMPRAASPRRIAALAALRPLPWIALAVLPFAANNALFSYRYYCGIYALCALLVAAAGLRQGWLLRPAPLANALRFVGTRSYGLYLSHFAVSMFLREAWRSALDGNLVENSGCIQVAMLASWLAVTFAVTEVLHRLVEAPMIAFGRRASDALRREHLFVRSGREALVAD